jgi:hypothetical protein
MVTRVGLALAVLLALALCISCVALGVSLTSTEKHTHRPLSGLAERASNHAKYRPIAIPYEP